MTTPDNEPELAKQLALAERRLRRAEAAQLEAETLLETIARNLDRSNSELRRRESSLVAKLDIDNRNLIRAQRTAALATIYRNPNDDFVLSPQLSEILGLAPGERADGDIVLAALHPLDRARIEVAAAAFFAGQVAADTDHRYECRIVRTDGQIRWLRWIIRREPGDAGDVVIGTVQDITEQRAAERRARALKLVSQRNLKRLQRTEARLAERVAQLEQLSAELRASTAAAAAASAAKSQFLVAMSHRIRTPMNGVLGMMTALRQTNLDDRQLAQLDRAQAAGDALRALIDDIIDIADSPMAADALAAPSAPENGQGEARPLLIEGRRPCILVADDIETNQIVLASMLDTLGCDHQVVSDGAQALAAARNGGIDAILMDVQMPVMDGAEATRQIRQLEGRAGQIPIIGVTAQAIQTERDALTAAGMTTCLAKPIGVPALAAALTSAFSPSPQVLLDAATFTAALAPLRPDRRRLLFDQMVSDIESLVSAFAAATAENNADGVSRARHSLTGIASAFGANAMLAILDASREPGSDSAAAATDLATVARTTIAAGRQLLRQGADT
jgi:PAS domain S-box-containing protein